MNSKRLLTCVNVTSLSSSVVNSLSNSESIAEPHSLVLLSVIPFCWRLVLLVLDRTFLFAFRIFKISEFSLKIYNVFHLPVKISVKA